MKPFANKLFLITAFILTFTSCTKEDTGVYFNEMNTIPEVKTSYSEIEFEILETINNYRVSINLLPLERLNIISSVAFSHTDYMVKSGEVNHYNFGERQQLLVSNANAKSVGENVAYGYNSAQGVVNAWLNSDEHRALIENSAYTNVGISTEKNSENRNYFTLMFIEK